MPIEIKELVIRATVDSGGSGSKGPRKRKQAAEREEIVAECVEQVMRILRRQGER